MCQGAEHDCLRNRQVQLKKQWSFGVSNQASQVNDTERLKIVGKEVFQYPISGSEKYQNEFPTQK